MLLIINTSAFYSTLKALTRCKVHVFDPLMAAAYIKRQKSSFRFKKEQEEEGGVWLCVCYLKCHKSIINTDREALSLRNIHAGSPEAAAVTHSQFLKHPTAA